MKTTELCDQKGYLLGTLFNIHDAPRCLFKVTDDRNFLQTSVCKHSLGEKRTLTEFTPRKNPELVTSQESILVFSGMITLNVFDTVNNLISSNLLTSGDVFVYHSGKFSYEILEHDTLLLINSYGPYYHSK